jgi:hypothetical protein
MPIIKRRLHLHVENKFVFKRVTGPALCHFVHHESHVEYSGIESGSPWLGSLVTNPL